MPIDAHGHAATRIDASLLKRRGRAVNLMVAAMVENDQEFLSTASPKEIQNYMVRTRRAAFHAIVEEQARQTRAAITVTEFQARAQEIVNRASESAARILEQARANFATVNQASIIEEERGINFNEDFEEIEESEEVEQDVENLANGMQAGAEHTINVCLEDDAPNDDLPEATNTTTGANQDVPVDQLPWSEVAGAFLGTLQDNTLSQFAPSSWSPEDLTCHLCKEDETVPEELANKLYSKPSALQYHMDSLYHNRRSEFGRRAMLRYARTRHIYEDAGLAPRFISSVNIALLKALTTSTSTTS